MGNPKDSFGLEIHDGDVVAATGTHDTKLLGQLGVVVRSRCEDLIGVQLGDRLLSCSMHPEVLYSAPNVWSITARGRGFEA